MTDPLTASVLVTLEIQEFIKSGTGDLAKRFTAIETITKNLDVILDEDSLFAEELRILGQEIQAGKISQIGLDDLEAGELDAEIDQTVKGKTTTKTEQIGTKGVRVTGKATIKIKQNID
ncbi:hypothetical protein IQ232_04055 [Microcystis aeruginosa LEGE 11464]|uniref:hypothetical protein n=1 Tax=Microcystis aeruginosa TaxID=1126 RepID=UPI001880C6E8|nr:hypothetical protein [Microcystis aeruginosa]MBE9088984.1 hypothetical protein [Microcystis aeruginosa LEGE 11464]